MRFLQYLNEKTFNIGKDVDYIYNKYFKKSIQLLKKGKFKMSSFRTKSFKSSDLPSVKAKKASEVNPMNIIVTLSDGGNYYNSVDKKIQLTLNTNALDYYLNVPMAMRDISDRQKESLKAEINGNKMKASIYHELTHWLDDTFHNYHIRKNTEDAYDAFLKTRDNSMAINVRKLGKDDINATYYEVNAQIHNIKQMKRMHKTIWDKLTFEEMIKLDGSLLATHDTLKGRERVQWKKDILLRMSREKLVGKKMRFTR